MALNNLGVGITITARNLAAGPLRQVGAQVNSTKNQVTAAGAAMRAGFGLAAGGAVGLFGGIMTLRSAFGAANAAGEFQQQIAGIGAVTNATTEQLGQLRNAAIQAGIDTQFSPTEATQGLQSLATAGQTVEQSISTLVPVLDLAAGSLGQLGVEGAAEAVVGTLNSYQMSADDAANVTDRLLRITQLTNFQARDFAAGLSKAAAAGATFGQNLDDTLITMGLMRNANIDASSASTAFRESVRRLGSDKNAQSALEGLVDIFDEQSGAMRSVVDIMSDLVVETEDLTEKERNAIVARAFGARGLLAFNAVSKATFTTMRDGQRVTLEGAEAIAALRQEMEGAEGAAESMREQLLDTFAGQKQLLSGTLETLAIVIGESFATVLKPIVGAVVDTLNAILQFFNNLPEPAKKVIAAFVLFSGVAFVLFGALTIVAGIITLLLPMLFTMLAVMALLAVVIAPIVIGFTMLGAAVGFFFVAAQRNVGGFGDMVANVWAKVKLAFQGIIQLFRDGGFSGAVRDEMRRAENEGVRNFVVAVFRIGKRILEFFRGLKAGFMAAVDAMAPLFEELKEAISDVGEAIGFVSHEVGNALPPMDGFARKGASVGVTLGNMFRVVVRGAIFAAKVFAGFIRGVRDNWHKIEPILDQFSASWERLGQAVNGFGAQTEETLEGASSGAERTGGQIGSAFVTAAGLFVRFMGSIIDTFTFFIEIGATVGRTIERIDLWFTELGIRTNQIWMGIVDTIRDALDMINIAIADAVSLLPENMRTPEMQRLVAVGESSEFAVGMRQAQAQARTRTARGMIRGIDERRRELDAEAARQAGEERDSALIEGVVNDLAKRREDERQVLVNVQVDGETIARAAGNGAREEQERAFRMVPAEVSD